MSATSPSTRRRTAATLCIAAISATVLFMLAGCTQPAQSPGPVTETTASVGATSTPSTGTSASVPGTSTSVKVPSATLTREPALITKVSGTSSSGYNLTADYVQILTGDAAAMAATQAGQESPPPNGYFIANTNTKLRTFALPATAKVTVLGWNGADVTKPSKISVSKFASIMNSSASTNQEYVDGYYYVTVKDGKTVTKVEQIFFP